MILFSMHVGMVLLIVTDGKCSFDLLGRTDPIEFHVYATNRLFGFNLTSFLFVDLLPHFTSFILLRLSWSR